jgi:chromosome segregation ATPase
MTVENSDITDTVTVINSDTDRVDDRLIFELRTRIDQLESKLDKAQREVQSAAFRNGYLESQIEAERQNIKLLTDRQATTSYWSRFKSWLLGQ